MSRAEGKKKARAEEGQGGGAVPDAPQRSARASSSSEDAQHHSLGVSILGEIKCATATDLVRWPLLPLLQVPLLPIPRPLSPRARLVGHIPISSPSSPPSSPHLLESYGPPKRSRKGKGQESTRVSKRALPAKLSELAKLMVDVELFIWNSGKMRLSGEGVAFELPDGKLPSLREIADMLDDEREVVSLRFGVWARG